MVVCEYHFDATEVPFLLPNSSSGRSHTSELFSDEEQKGLSPDVENSSDKYVGQHHRKLWHGRSDSKQKRKEKRKLKQQQKIETQQHNSAV